MENQYGIAIRNKYDLFLEEEDPLEILKQQEAKNAAKKAEKTKKPIDEKEQKPIKSKQISKTVTQTPTSEIKASEKAEKIDAGKQQQQKPSVKNTKADLVTTKPLQDRNNRQNNKNESTAINPSDNNINTTTEYGIFESQSTEKRPRKTPSSDFKSNIEMRGPRDDNRQNNTERTGFQSARGPRHDDDRQGGNRPAYRGSGGREDRIFRNSDRSYRDGPYNRQPRRQGFNRPDGEPQINNNEGETTAQTGEGFTGGFGHKPPQTEADGVVERPEENAQDGVGGRRFNERRGGFGPPRRGFGNFDDNRGYKGERRGFGNRRYGNENEDNGENNGGGGERHEYGYRGRGGPRRGRGGFRNNDRDVQQNDEGGEQQQQKSEFAADGESFGHWESPKGEESSRPQRRGRGRGRGGGYSGKREFNRHNGGLEGSESDKKEGGGNHNWGTVEDDLQGQTETATTMMPVGNVKASWADQTEAEFEESVRTGEITDAPQIFLSLDEYKAIEEKKRIRAELNIRKAGEGCPGDAKWNQMHMLQQKKKEKSTDCDSALIPLLCVHG